MPNEANAAIRREILASGLFREAGAMTLKTIVDADNAERLLALYERILGQIETAIAAAPIEVSSCRASSVTRISPRAPRSTSVQCARCCARRFRASDEERHRLTPPRRSRVQAYREPARPRHDAHPQTGCGVKTFEYEVIIERARSRAPRTVRRIAFSRPLVGEEIVIDDRVYVVERVQHQQDEGRTVRVYTFPRLFVRPKLEA